MYVDPSWPNHSYEYFKELSDACKCVTYYETSTVLSTSAFLQQNWNPSLPLLLPSSLLFLPLPLLPFLPPSPSLPASPSLPVSPTFPPPSLFLFSLPPSSFSPSLSLLSGERL